MFPAVKFGSGSRRSFGLPAWALLVAAASAGLSACIGGPDARPRDGQGVAVELQILPAGLAKSAAARPVDSVHVRVSGPGMDTVHFGFGGSPASVSLAAVPPGESRLFFVRLFRGGRLLYAGEATISVASSGKNVVTVHCLPEFSRVTASVHVSDDFARPVTGGTLRLWSGADTLEASAVVQGELRNFRLEEVPGDLDYSVFISLWDDAGDTVAQASRAGLHIHKGQSVALAMPLELTFGRLSLTMTVADPFTTSIVLGLPGGRRAPAAFGELVFSELYPIPTAEEGGDSGEWLEFFNRSADTLDVGGCVVTRDAGTSPSMLATLPGGTVVPPGRTLLVGKSAAPGVQVVLGSSALTLTNSSARLAFSCASGGVLLDTLRYSSSGTDTLAVRIQAAKAASLRPSRLSTRHAAEAWCLAAPVPAAGEFAATPGALAGGCGE